MRIIDHKNEIHCKATISAIRQNKEESVEVFEVRSAIREAFVSSH